MKSHIWYGIIAVLLLTIVIEGGIYLWKSSSAPDVSVQDQSMSNDDVAMEYSEEENDVQEDVSYTSNVPGEKPDGGACESDGKGYFDIPELGISVLVDESIKDDLIYTISSDNSVYFSTKRLKSLDPHCEILSITKFKGVPSDYEGPASSGVNKQFDDSFISFGGSHSPCFDNEGIIVNDNETSKVGWKTDKDIQCIKEIN